MASNYTEQQLHELNVTKQTQQNAGDSITGAEIRTVAAAIIQTFFANDRLMAEYITDVIAAQTESGDLNFATLQSIEQKLRSAQLEPGDPQALPLLVRTIGGASTYARLNQYQHQRFEGYSQMDFTPYTLDIYFQIQVANESFEQQMYSPFMDYSGYGWKDLMEFGNCYWQFAAPDGRRLTYYRGIYNDTIGLGLSSPYVTVPVFLKNFVLGKPRDGQISTVRTVAATNSTLAGNLGTFTDASTGAGFDVLAHVVDNTGEFPPAVIGCRFINKSASPIRIFYNTLRKEQTPGGVEFTAGVTIEIPAGEEFKVVLNCDRFSEIRAGLPFGPDGAGRLVVESELLTVYDMAPFSGQSQI